MRRGGALWWYLEGKHACARGIGEIRIVIPTRDLSWYGCMDTWTYERDLTSPPT